MRLRSLSPLLLLVATGCERRVVSLDGEPAVPADTGTTCPVLYVSAATLAWPDSSLDGTETQSILLSNLCDGEGDLVMAISLDVEGSEAFDFEVGGATLQPGSTTRLVVSFTPTDIEDHTNTLTIVSNAAEPAEADIDLSGNAVADADGDGHDSIAADGDDCDDRDGSVYPGADEIWYDGLDNDCDGVVDHVDVDVAAGWLRGEAEDYLGYRRSLSVGELNGDGHPDIIVGGMLLGLQGAWQGAVGVVSSQDYSDWEGELQGYVVAELTGDAQENYLGWMDSRQTDIDGDGADDLLVMASDSDYASQGNRAGGIIFGPVEGSRTASDADVSFTGAQSGYNFSGLNRLDVDGDGLHEVFWGDWMPAPSFPGWVLGFGGSGLATGGERNLYWDADRAWYGGSGGDSLGSAMGGGDLDGDGYDDLILTAPYADVGGDNSGSAYVFPGAATLEGVQQVDRDYALQLHGASSEDMLGYQSPPLVEDFDGDGELDLAMGAPAIGSVYLWYGVESLKGLDTANSADTILRSEGAAWFGLNMAAGDLDADGVTDLAVSAPDYHLLYGAHAASDQPGEVYVFSGAGLEPGTISSGQANLSIAGPSDSDLFGISMVLADLSGNGVDEMLVAAPRAGGAGEGYLWVFDDLQAR